MVINQKMKETEMGNRVSKSGYNPVKEQRVYGSLCDISKPLHLR